MYFTLILENESGEQLNLSTTANQYMTSKIEGLNPPAGTISTSSYAGMNGSYLNNAFIEKRNVVISFAMCGIGIEKRRHQLYRVVKPSRYIRIWYKTANIDVYAEGYVETCEVSNFEQQISGQISILCPDIYWYSRDIFYAYYSGVIGAFHFPFPESDAPFPLGVYSNSNLFSITNDGDETGFTLRIEAVSYTHLDVYKRQDSDREYAMYCQKSLFVQQQILPDSENAPRIIDSFLQTQSRGYKI